MRNILFIFLSLPIGNVWFDIGQLIGLLVCISYIWRLARVFVTKKDLKEELIKKADAKIMDKNFEIQDQKIMVIETVVREVRVNIAKDIEEIKAMQTEQRNDIKELLKR